VTKVFAITLLLAVGGCAWMKSSSEKPIGYGGATDELKKSPCACDEPFYRNGRWVS
jgi:hypothetical protein